MMLYHDGLRTLTAETARHSSKVRAPLSDLLLYFSTFLHFMLMPIILYNRFFSIYLCICT
ncbi:hypothetical protein K439DRAFT_995232 [Ramaria rubella]|nr:hypothetical protein K439DRAFT_995232 [Ramaria rubella]